MSGTCTSDPRFERLERFLRDVLPPEEAARAEAHVASCRVCADERRAILADRALLRSVATEVPTTAAARAHEIAERALSPERGGSGLRLGFALGAAAAAVVVAVLFLRGMGEGPLHAPVQPHVAEAPLPRLPDAGGTREAVPGPDVVVAAGMPLPEVRFGTPVEVPEGAGLVLRLEDGSAIALGEASRATVAIDAAGATVILDHGEVECRVTPLARGRSFVVRSPDLEVRVHGTRFVVRSRQRRSEVFVVEGLVEVRREGEEPERVGPSEPPPDLRLSSWLDPQGGAEPIASAHPRPGQRQRHDVAEEGARDLVRDARRLLSKRSYGEARTLLERHMAGHPGDLEARYLLGEAQRLGRDPAAARETFERLAARGRGRVAQNALARLALLAERSGPAAALAAWDRYLAAFPRGTLAAEATLHRVNALVALGRHAEARAALESFLRRYPDHPRRTEAQRRLEAVR